MLAGIINQGTSNYRYRGVSDNIFDKVFRGVYEEEIREFDMKMIRKEYSEELEKLKKEYGRLLGKHNFQKGYFGGGFTKDAEDYCREQGIACSEGERWLEGSS